MTNLVLFEVRDGIAVLTINRPERRNAVNLELCDALRDAFERVDGDPGIRVAVLTGAGGTFCAGMDLKAFAAGEGEAILFGEFGFGGFVKRARKKPVIAAVEGAALAGGFEMMLACDLAVASQTARFGLPEAKLGLVAGAGGAIRLAQRIPRVHANEVLLTGKAFTAERAFDLGLLNDVVSEGVVLQRALELATEISDGAPLSVQESLALSNAAFGPFEHWEENDRSLRALGETEDSREGARAFIEKRKPVWRGF